MMKTLKIITAAALAITLSACGGNEDKESKKEEKKPKRELESSEGQACTYSFDAEKTEVRWTGYKHSTKVPVAGTFTKISFEGPTSADSPEALAEGMIATALTSSIFSGDTTRDAKLSNIFFANMVGGESLTAGVKNVEVAYDNMNGTGSCILQVTMNGVDFDVPSVFSVSDNKMNIKATINLDDWNTTVAYDAIHEACSEKHTLESDGKPITHKEVLIEITTTMTKDCK